MVISWSVINILANICVILPYYILFNHYSVTHDISFLIAIGVVYAARSVSILLVRYYPTKVYNIVDSVMAGLIGSVLIAIFPFNFWLLLIASLFIGYHAGTLWPNHIFSSIDGGFINILR